jgi:hypothetical protein
MPYAHETHIVDRACANSLCRKPVDRSHEFVLQVSTVHVRWFCGVDCVIEGKQAWQEEIISEGYEELMREERAHARAQRNAERRRILDEGRPR